MISDLFGDDSFGSYVAAYIITFKIAYLNSFYTCVDKFEISRFVISADYDTDVTDVLSASATCEEHQISFAEILAGYAHPLRILCARGWTQGISELAIYIA